jgi:esterase/lipase superfamily enzyme
MRKQGCAFLTLFVVVALAGCKSRELMPTPNLYVGSDRDPLADVVPVYRTSSVELLYVTDRQPEEARDGSLEYGYGRSASGAFGTCVVEIGKDVPWDTLVENSRVKKRTVKLPLEIVSISELGRMPGTPLPLEEIGGKLVDDPAALAQTREVAGRLRGELKRRLDLTPRKEAFIFIHGYHNTFEDAAFTLAEMWHFLGREGVPILYTWPAGPVHDLSPQAGSEVPRGHSRAGGNPPHRPQPRDGRDQQRDPGASPRGPRGRQGPSRRAQDQEHCSGGAGP